MKQIKKYKTQILVISVSSIIFILTQIVFNNLNKHVNLINCNTCDSLVLKNTMTIEYLSKSKNKNIKCIRKSNSIVKESNFTFIEIDSSYFYSFNKYQIEIKINLKDTIKIIDKNKKYLLYSFKRKYVKAKYPPMGADKTGYEFELKHPCENYGATVFANKKSKFIICDNGNNVFIINEKDFY